MTLVRVFGWMLLFPAVLVLSYGLVLWHDGIPVFQIAARDYLAMAGPPGPDPIQAAAQRYLSGALVDPGSAEMLLWPVAAALGLVAALVSVPGAFILVLFRRGWSRTLVRQQYSR